MTTRTVRPGGLKKLEEENRKQEEALRRVEREGKRLAEELGKTELRLLEAETKVAASIFLRVHCVLSGVDMAAAIRLERGRESGTRSRVRCASWCDPVLSHYTSPARCRILTYLMPRLGGNEERA